MAYAAEKARYLLGLFGTTTIGQERPIVLIAKVLEDLPASLGCQAPHQRETDDTKKNESINEIGRLLREIAIHLSVDAKMDARKAVTKL